MKYPLLKNYQFSVFWHEKDQKWVAEEQSTHCKIMHHNPKKALKKIMKCFHGQEKRMAKVMKKIEKKK